MNRFIENIVGATFGSNVDRTAAVLTWSQAKTKPYSALKVPKPLVDVDKSKVIELQPQAPILIESEN